MQPATLSHDYHPRALDDNRYVYAVLSRRAGGVSIGVNLNPDKVCNFDCVYCQVDRTSPGNDSKVDLGALDRELRAILSRAKSGGLFTEAPFAGIEKRLQRITDIAFSGDGEPTTCPGFKQAVEIAIAAKDDCGLADLKLVLITNATMFHRPKVKEALSLFDRNGGEIWAKLDAGTESYFNRVDVTTIPFQRILDNLLQAASIRPITIQSLFMRLHDEPPDSAEIDAYCRRLSDIASRGGMIRRVQIYTVARRPAQSYVSPLSDAELEAIAERLRDAGLEAIAFCKNL